MAYFTAVAARAGSVWRARDVELDGGGTLEDVTGVLPSVAVRAVGERHDDDPGAVRADVGEQVGFGELIEALR